MVIISTLTFNGKTLDPRRFRCEHQPDYQIPEPDYDRIHVDGRDGDIIIPSKSYKNIPRTYNISFGAAGPEDFAAAVSEISKWLECEGYGELEDSYEKEYYRLAVPVGGPKVTNILNGQMGKVTVEFSCVPKRYLKYGQSPIIIPAENDEGDIKIFRIYNPTEYDVKPIIYVYPRTVNGTIPTNPTCRIRAAESIVVLNGTDLDDLPCYDITVDLKDRILQKDQFGVADVMATMLAIAIDCESEDAYSLFDPYKIGGVKGDVNFDNNIDVNDYTLALKEAIRTPSSTYPALDADQKYRADMDNDGVITTEDARAIMRKAESTVWKKNLNSLVHVYGDGFPVLKAKTNNMIWFEGYASQIAILPRFWTR